MAFDRVHAPRAHGVVVGRGRLRVVPEDFRVREWLGFTADGQGEHWLLQVRKRNANTTWVAKQLARIAGVAPRDVGFAGLKDRNAIAEQAFTVPAARVVDWLTVRGEGFEVVAAERHRRKLKRGALRGNDFDIVVREFAGDAVAVEERLTAIARAGVPNYFGPQRFGMGGHNVELARAWFGGAGPPQDRVQRSLALSAARSALFNMVLAERVRQRTWDALRPGDVANLDGSGSIFLVDALDEALAERCRLLDVHPTGPLWGAGTLATRGDVLALEQAIVMQESSLAEGLERVGLDQERRALRVRVTDCAWTLEEATLRLHFRLPRGAYATAVLHELIDDVFSQPLPDADLE